MGLCPCTWELVRVGEMMYQQQLSIRGLQGSRESVGRLPSAPLLTGHVPWGNHDISVLQVWGGHGRLQCTPTSWETLSQASVARWSNSGHTWVTGKQ